MKDKKENVVTSLQGFANDSINFFNKCAKPDRNGNYYSVHINIQTVLYRVHENSSGMCNGFLSYRIHWLYNKASLYPHQ
jgi:hypothetical protein